MYLYMYMYVCIYIYIYTLVLNIWKRLKLNLRCCHVPRLSGAHLCVYIYIYIYRERERHVYNVCFVVMRTVY